MKITWQEIKDIFAGSSREDLEDRQVYVNIHRYNLHKVACRYPAFPCVDIFTELSHIQILRLWNWAMLVEHKAYYL